MSQDEFEKKARDIIKSFNDTEYALDLGYYGFIKLMEVIAEALRAEAEKWKAELETYKANNNAARWNELLGKRMDQIKDLETELDSCKSLMTQDEKGWWGKIKDLEARIQQLEEALRNFIKGYELIYEHFVRKHECSCHLDNRWANDYDEAKQALSQDGGKEGA